MVRLRVQRVCRHHREHPRLAPVQRSPGAEFMVAKEEPTLLPNFTRNQSILKVRGCILAFQGGKERKRKLNESSSAFRVVLRNR